MRATEQVLNKSFTRFNFQNETHHCPGGAAQNRVVIAHLRDPCSQATVAILPAHKLLVVTNFRQSQTSNEIVGYNRRKTNRFY